VLDVLDPPLRAAFRATRRDVHGAALRASFDATMALLCETRTAVRAGGRAFVDRDVERLDQRLGDVGRSLCASLHRAVRGSPGAAEGAGQYRTSANAGADSTAAALVASTDAAVRAAKAVVTRPREALAGLVQHEASLAAILGVQAGAPGARAS
jgi:hypothetical protein